MLILKHKDEELLRFEVLKNIEEPVLKILWKNNKKKNLLPLDLEVTENGLAKWIKRRNIPKNRAFVDNDYSNDRICDTFASWDIFK